MDRLKKILMIAWDGAAFFMLGILLGIAIYQLIRLLTLRLN
jgi:hypothetical protein